MAEAQVQRRISCDVGSPGYELSVPGLNDTTGDEIMFLGGASLSNKELLSFVENTVTTCCHLISKLTGKALPVGDFVPTAKVTDPNEMRLFFVPTGVCTGPSFKYRGQYLFIKTENFALTLPLLSEQKVEKQAPLEENLDAFLPDLNNEDNEMEDSASDAESDASSASQNVNKLESPQPVVTVPTVSRPQRARKTPKRYESSGDEKDNVAQSEKVGHPKRLHKSPKRYGSSANESDGEAEEDGNSEDEKENDAETEAPASADSGAETVDAASDADDDGKAEMDDGDGDADDGEAEMDDGDGDADDGEAEIADGDADDDEGEIADGEAEIADDDNDDSGEAEIDDDFEAETGDDSGDDGVAKVANDDDADFEPEESDVESENIADEDSDLDPDYVPFKKDKSKSSDTLFKKSNNTLFTKKEKSKSISALSKKEKSKAKSVLSKKSKSKQTVPADDTTGESSTDDNNGDDSENDSLDNSEDVRNDLLDEFEHLSGELHDIQDKVAQIGEHAHPSKSKMKKSRSENSQSGTDTKAGSGDDYLGAMMSALSKKNTARLSYTDFPKIVDPLDRAVAKDSSAAVGAETVAKEIVTVAGVEKAREVIAKIVTVEARTAADIKKTGTEKTPTVVDIKIGNQKALKVVGAKIGTEKPQKVVVPKIGTEKAQTVVGAKIGTKEAQTVFRAKIETEKPQNVVAKMGTTVVGTKIGTEKPQKVVGAKIGTKQAQTEVDSKIETEKTLTVVWAKIANQNTPQVQFRSDKTQMVVLKKIETEKAQKMVDSKIGIEKTLTVVGAKIGTQNTPTMVGAKKTGTEISQNVVLKSLIGTKKIPAVVSAKFGTEKAQKLIDSKLGTEKIQTVVGAKIGTENVQTQKQYIDLTKDDDEEEVGGSVGKISVDRRKVTPKTGVGSAPDNKISVAGQDSAPLKIVQLIKSVEAVQSVETQDERSGNKMSVYDCEVTADNVQSVEAVPSVSVDAACSDEGVEALMIDLTEEEGSNLQNDVKTFVSKETVSSGVEETTNKAELQNDTKTLVGKEKVSSGGEKTFIADMQNNAKTFVGKEKVSSAGEKTNMADLQNDAKTLVGKAKVSSAGEKTNMADLQNDAKTLVGKAKVSSAGEKTNMADLQNDAETLVAKEKVLSGSKKCAIAEMPTDQKITVGRETVLSGGEKIVIVALQGSENTAIAEENQSKVLSGSQVAQDGSSINVAKVSSNLTIESKVPVFALSKASGDNANILSNMTPTVNNYESVELVGDGDNVFADSIHEDTITGDVSVETLSVNSDEFVGDGDNVSADSLHADTIASEVTVESVCNDSLNEEKKSLTAGENVSRSVETGERIENVAQSCNKKVRMGPKSYMQKYDPERFSDDTVSSMKQNDSSGKELRVGANYHDHEKKLPTVFMNRLPDIGQSVKVLKREPEVSEMDLESAKRIKLDEEYSIIKESLKRKTVHDKITYPGRNCNSYYEVPVGVTSTGRRVRKPERFEEPIFKKYRTARSVMKLKETETPASKKKSETETPASKKTSKKSKKCSSSVSKSKSNEATSPEAHVLVGLINSQNLRNVVIDSETITIGSENVTLNFVRNKPESIPRNMSVTEISANKPPSWLCSKDHDDHTEDCFYVNCVECRGLDLCCNVRWRGLPSHLAGHTTDAVFFCSYAPYCHSVSYSEEARLRHDQEHNCRVCHATYRTIDEVKEHKTYHRLNDSATYTCGHKTCLRFKGGATKVLEHFRIDHSEVVTKDDVIVCGCYGDRGQCLATFSNDELFHSHVYSAHECRRCHKKFNSYGDKAKHDLDCLELPEYVLAAKLLLSTQTVDMTNDEYSQNATDDKLRRAPQKDTNSESASQENPVYTCWQVNVPLNPLKADGRIVLDDGSPCTFTKLPDFDAKGSKNEEPVVETPDPGDANEDEIDGDEISIRLKSDRHKIQCLRCVVIQTLLQLPPKTIVNIVLVVDVLDDEILKMNPKGFEIIKMLGKQANGRCIRLKDMKIKRPIADSNLDAEERWLLLTPRHFDCLFMHSFIALSLTRGGWLTPQSDGTWEPNRTINLADIVKDINPISMVSCTFPQSPCYHFSNLRRSCTVLPVKIQGEEDTFRGFMVTLLKPVPQCHLKPGQTAVIVILAATPDKSETGVALPSIFGNYANLFLNYAAAEVAICRDKRIFMEKPNYLMCSTKDLDSMYKSGYLEPTNAGMLSPANESQARVELYMRTQVAVALKGGPNNTVNCRGMKCKLMQQALGLPFGASVVVVLFVKKEDEVKNPWNAVALWRLFGERLMHNFLNYSATPVRRVNSTKKRQILLLCRPKDFDMLISNDILCLAARPTFHNATLSNVGQGFSSSSEYKLGFKMLKEAVPSLFRTTLEVKERRNGNLKHVQKMCADSVTVTVNVTDGAGWKWQCQAIKFKVKDTQRSVMVLVMESPEDVRNGVKSKALCDMFGVESSASLVNFSAFPIKCEELPCYVLGVQDFDQFWSTGKFVLDIVEILLTATDNSVPQDFRAPSLTFLAEPVTFKSLAAERLRRCVLSHETLTMCGVNGIDVIIHGLRFVLKKPILGLLPGYEVRFILFHYLSSQSGESSRSSVLVEMFGEDGPSYVNTCIPFGAFHRTLTHGIVIHSNALQLERLYKNGYLCDPIHGAATGNSVKISPCSGPAGLPSTVVITIDAKPVPMEKLLLANPFCVITEGEEEGNGTIKNESRKGISGMETEGAGVSQLEQVASGDWKVKFEPMDTDADTADKRTAENTKGSSTDNLVPKVLLGNTGGSTDMNLPCKYKCLRRGCDFQTDEKFEFYLHVKLVHSKQTLLHVCRCCRVEFSSEEELTKHITDHIEFPDTIPADVLNNYSGIPATADNSTTREINICRQCGHCVTNRVTFFKHVAAHGDMLWPCAQCGKKLRSSTELSLHSSLFHNLEKQYMCEVCFVRFTAFDDLLMHRKVFHLTK